MILKKYRKEIPKTTGDEYPMPVNRVLIPLEKLWMRYLGWKPQIAIDVACTPANKRYPNGFTEFGPSFDRPELIRQQKLFKQYEAQNSTANSLDLDWAQYSKYIYCMPPYNYQPPWVEKCKIAGLRGSIVVGIFAVSKSKPAKWFKREIVDDPSVFHKDLGRLKVDSWKAPNFNHVFCLFGARNTDLTDLDIKEFMRQLDLFVYNLADRISVTEMFDDFGGAVSKDFIIQICHDKNLPATCDGLPIRINRNKILWNEYQKFVIPEIIKIWC